MPLQYLATVIGLSCILYLISGRPDIEKEYVVYPVSVAGLTLKRNLSSILYLYSRPDLEEESVLYPVS